MTEEVTTLSEMLHAQAAMDRSRVNRLPEDDPEHLAFYELEERIVSFIHEDPTRAGLTLEGIMRSSSDFDVREAVLWAAVELARMKESRQDGKAWEIVGLAMQDPRFDDQMNEVLEAAYHNSMFFSVRSPENPVS